MTQYGVQIQFDDDEILTLTRALDAYLAQQPDQDSGLKFFDRHIREELSDNAKTPSGCGFFENELIIIEKALNIYSDICNRQIATGVSVPFSADREMIEQISARLSNEFLRAVIAAEMQWSARRKPDS